MFSGSNKILLLNIQHNTTSKVYLPICQGIIESRSTLEGVVKRDFEVGFLVSFDRSHVATILYGACFLLVKFRFRIKLFNFIIIIFKFTMELI
jgi:hypothetical protein